MKNTFSKNFSSNNKSDEDNKYFNYISSLIKSKDLQSLTPYYLCEEEGHQTNQLDIVCLDADCKHKGLICFRCQYHKHNTHANHCIPLSDFMANLVKNQNELSNLLSKKREKCFYLREYMIDCVKNAIEKIIDQFSIYVATLHKYYQLNEKKIEEITVKSDVVLHRLFFKKHINHYEFNSYISDVIVKLQHKNQKKIDEIEIVDYKEAIKLTDKYLEEMGAWANEINNNAEKLYFQAKKDIRLNILPNDDMRIIEESSINQELKGFTQNLLNKVKSSFKADFPKPNYLLMENSPENPVEQYMESKQKKVKFEEDSSFLTKKTNESIERWRESYLNLSLNKK